MAILASWRPNWPFIGGISVEAVPAEIRNKEEPCETRQLSAHC